MYISSCLTFLSLSILSLSVPLALRNTPLNTFLTLLLDHLPDINEGINDASSVITALDSLLAGLIHAKTTENELGSGSCAEYTLIFARGTSEPGNMGVLVGPPLVWALQDIVGTSGLTIQGVNDYSASVAGYLAGGDADGSSNMASLISQAYSSCPSTKLIAAGYSQGCQVTHNAISQLDSTTASWISKVLLFGDPDNGTAIPNVDSSKVHTVCHTGDNICVNGDFILVPHLTYAEDVATAASFATS
ncbi:putative cutinase [Talaromyces proteolyticus]|uniref:cutinase n=1 Tax=Talaromyces proteolyticus TaxID=1131652 RepID=A0AAD4Q1L1_9EURO|nr:putative cutinase [Talaromyces proteolyticus]KAH8702379.1 putative cutinase [Talaromyces proteolyticus]